jgi:hypothetical protein
VSLLRGGKEKFTTVEVPRQYSLSLLPRIGWTQCKVVGSAAGKVIGNGVVEYSAQNFL